jgi:hypothetical protein
VGVTVVWDDAAPTTVRIDFTGRWQWAEYDTAVQSVYALMQEVSSPVAIIANLRSGRLLAVGFAFAHFRATLRLLEAHIGFIVVIGCDGMTKTLVTAFLRVFPHIGDKTLFSDSLDEARRILNNHRR